MAKYLIDDYTLIIQPKLAVKIGLNEAIVIQQIHHFLLEKKNIRDGRYWTYNSYKGWQENFKFWSEATIKRTFHSLENKGLIIVGNYNKMPMDKTKWYSINYENFNSLFDGEEEFDGTVKSDQSSGHIDPIVGSDCTEQEVNVTQAIPNISSNISSNISINTLSASQPKSSKQDNIPYAEIIDYLNKATNRSYRNVESNKKLIRFRWKEGYTLTDFFTVIDKKTQEWKNTKMEKYLQPSTLFGSKFDQYLNQEVTNNGTYWTSSGANTETNTSEGNINAGFERLSKENAHKFKPVDITMHDVF